MQILKSLSQAGLVTIGLSALLMASATHAAHASEWKLVWSDEFDRPGLPDAAKWQYETGFVRNDEQQIYTKARRENARVENGLLVIEARKETYQSGPSGRTARYTSASLTTLGKASWTYGRIEVRAKLPSGRGTWPAIWTLGQNFSQVGWPSCGEIDIMEFVGYMPGVIHANIHTKKYNHAINTGKGATLAIPDVSRSFHAYAIEWDEKRIDFFVDGKKYFTFANEASGPDTWPYDKPQYLLLNLAVGGAWGGQKGIDDQIFPQRYEIDYVRVYQK